MSAIAKTQVELLRRALAPADPDLLTYVVLDGAAIDRLLARLHAPDCPPGKCLFPGELAADMMAVAPYVLPFDPRSTFGEWVLEAGWGRHYGVILHTRADLAGIWRHLRTIVKVFDADGRPLYFRFYDPRVLRLFLPTCSAAQLGTLFGPIEAFCCEGDNDRDALAFRNTGTGLTRQLLLQA